MCIRDSGNSLLRLVFQFTERQQVSVASRHWLNLIVRLLQLTLYMTKNCIIIIVCTSFICRSIAFLKSTESLHFGLLWMLRCVNDLKRCKKPLVFKVNSPVFYALYVSTSAFLWNEFLQVYLSVGLITAWQTPDSIRHHCKHSNARKRTKKQKVSLILYIIKYMYRPNDFIS